MATPAMTARATLFLNKAFKGCSSYFTAFLLSDAIFLTARMRANRFLDMLELVSDL